MKHLYTLLIALWLSVSVSWAAPDAYKCQKFFEYIQSICPKVTGASYSGNTCTKFDFNGASAQEISDANKHLGEFAAFTPPPKPDYKAFKGSVFADNNVPLGVRLELMKFYPVLDYIEKGEASVEQLQAAWAGIGAQLDQDAPGVRALIEQHATDTHVPLVP